jgi:hypothetical protein
MIEINVKTKKTNIQSAFYVFYMLFKLPAGRAVLINQAQKPYE